MKEALIFTLGNIGSEAVIKPLEDTYITEKDDHLMEMIIASFGKMALSEINEVRSRATQALNTLTL